MTDCEIAALGVAAAEADDLWLASLCQLALGRSPSPLGRTRGISAGEARGLIEARTDSVMACRDWQVSIDVPEKPCTVPGMRQLSAERLRRFRGTLTRRQVYDRSGVPQDTLSKLEDGSRSSANSDTLGKLADAYGCAIDDFFEDSDSDSTGDEAA